jgi:hypothetical protein
LPTHSLRLVSSRAYRTPDLRESKAYWQYYGKTEDRSLSKYDGYFPFVGQAPAAKGQTCVYSDSYVITGSLFVPMAHPVSVLPPVKLAIMVNCPNSIYNLIFGFLKTITIK